MTNARPNALSLTVAVAISSSIVSTQTLADRRLQTRSVDISGSEHVEFIQSEVLVQPTPGDDQQPIPKSFTTTYPDQTEVRAGFDVPSEGFTDILSGIEGGVTSVDLFATGENDVAQKYTKVLKVGDEGVFRFSHNLAEDKLVIEVRKGMTDQNSIAAVRAQSGDIQPLDPFTNIANPEQLAGVLKGANERAGSLGEADHYVALATVEVKKVAVNGRTFMRLIAAGDQPPELKRLGQSLFVNDEALFAAATSAYTQVHVLGGDIQQQVLQDLLFDHKPVGYVVYVEDDTQAYHVPELYPTLEVAEISEKMIVFRGQKQNPADIALAETLFYTWEKYLGDDPDPAITTLVKKDKLRSYQYSIRSRQMQMLEELAAYQDIKFDAYQPEMLAYYESLLQALIIATPDKADEFELTLGHIRVAASVTTPSWLQIQLAKHFRFKPRLRNLLNNPHFVEKIQEITTFLADINRTRIPEEYEEFTSEVMNNKDRQLLEIYNKLEELRAKQPEIRKPNKKLLRAMAAEPGIDDWNDIQPPEEKARLIRKKMRPVPATGKSRKKAIKEILTDLENTLEITPDNENDLDLRYQGIQQYLHQNEGLIHGPVQHKLAIFFEGQLGLVPDNKMDTQVSSITESENDADIKALCATVARYLNIQDFDSDADVEVQQERLIQKLKTMNVQGETLRQQLKAMSAQEESLREQLSAMGNLLHREAFYTRARKDALAEVLGINPGEDPLLEDRASLESKVNDMLFELSELETELEDIKTPGHPEVMPEVLETLLATLTGLEGKNYFHFREKENVYDLRQSLSEKMHLHIREARKRSEEEALNALHGLEILLNIKVNVSDYKAARMERLLARLDARHVSNFELDEMRRILWEAGGPGWRDLEGNPEEIKIKLNSIRHRLRYVVEEPDQRARIRQAGHLIVLEDQLNIAPYENPAARGRGKSLTDKLASDLNIGFEDDAQLTDRQYALGGRIQELRDELLEVHEDEDARRAWNNNIAHQLKVIDYEDDASIDDQNRLIRAKLQQLDEEVFKAGQPDVNERLAAIDEELDRQVARLGPKPRYILDSDAGRARRMIAKAESELADVHCRLNRLSNNKDDNDSIRSIKALQSELNLSGKLQTLPEREQARLEDEIETRKADIERMKGVLMATEKAIESDGGPFQFTLEQAKVLKDIHKLTQQHPLIKQALEAAIGLRKAAKESGKALPGLVTFDFDDEFAPIRLQAGVGDKLTFKQASRIVEIFKRLKTTSFPAPTLEQPRNAIKEVNSLAHRAWDETGNGAQEYDNEIHGIGLAGIHSEDPEPEDLKSFPEYFASHSASGNKIITLLHEGLISKAELENYMKVVRGLDGYQTVDEFEHFLGYRHGVNVPHFKAAVRMLSDQGAEKFMLSAFTPASVTATGPAAMKESVVGMKEYAAAVITNYVLDDIAFENGRRTAAFLANAQDTLTPYAHAVGISESELIKAIHGTLLQAHATAVEQQLNDYWLKPSAFLVQAVTWYYSSHKPLLVTHDVWQAAELSFSNMLLLYLLDLTNRGDYAHRMLTPFQHWLELYGVDPDRTGQYAYHSGIEKFSEAAGRLAMPLGKAASSVILLKTGSMLFARQYNASPHRYRSISRLVPEIMKSMGSGQGVQVPLLHSLTPQKVKTLASATAGLVMGPVATFGAYAHGLVSWFTYAQTFGFALASSLTFDFFMNDNRMLTQWLGGPLGRGLDKINRWRGVGETDAEYLKRTAIASPQGFSENDEEYANRVKENDMMHGWTRHENYLQFRERRDRTMKLFENGWENYFKKNVPKWSFSHAESIPYSYTLGAFYNLQQGDEQKISD
ncbi:hypothetical protein [Endozoicomonas sp. ALB032]|uniref:hypothetical protein n=1 Tax=Endozoicomonas sp. ALB032 TaxID=3403082 RepID=UPI003BB59D32